MPRVTAPDVINELVINDAVSGDAITLYYRLPTTEERVRYSRGQVRKKGKKVVSAVAETRQEHGRNILTGFKEGDFVKPVNGNNEPYSWDKNSPIYDKNWKSLVCTYASDLVEFLAQQVYEGNTRFADIFGDDEDEPGQGDTEEDGPAVPEPPEGAGVLEEISVKKS